MNLEKIYNELKGLIDKVDFKVLWPDFKPLKFAIYNDKECFFNGAYIEKTEDFIANTSILYHGEYIAIWHCREEVESEILASKMIHEMFHAFQMQNNEERFANEFEALEKYQYDDENLSIKYIESNLLVKLNENFNAEDFKLLLSIRKFREMNHSYEFDYEAKVEQIEGTASFVELLVLKQLSTKYYDESLKRIASSLLSQKNYFPIRIISYDIGALLLLVLRNNNISFDYSFTNQPISCSMLTNVNLKKYNTELIFNDLIASHYKNIDLIFAKAFEQNNVIDEGSFVLQGLNVYNALFSKGYAFSEGFLMYQKANSSVTLTGNYVFSLNQGLITKIYEIKN